jgi:hypothetical protein
MACSPFTPEDLQEIRELAARWGKSVARRAFGDTGPGLDVDLRALDQLAQAAARGLTEGTAAVLSADDRLTRYFAERRVSPYRRRAQ